MKRLIVKHRPVGKTRRLVPFQAIAHIHRLRLLADAHLDIILLGVANLRPALVPLHLWSRVGVTLRLNLLRASDVDGVHGWILLLGSYTLHRVFDVFKLSITEGHELLQLTINILRPVD